MTINRCTLALIVLLTAFIPAALCAEPFSPFRSRISLHLSPRQDAQGRHPLHVGLATPEGRQRLTLWPLQTPDSAEAGLTLLQGFSTSRRAARQPAAGDLSEGRLRLFLSGRRRGRLFQAVLPMQDLGSKSGWARLSHSTLHTAGFCALSSAAQTGFGQAPPPSIAAAPLYSPPRVLTISTDADHEFFLAFQRDGDTQTKTVTRVKNEIAAILNAANALYMRQLGLRLSLKDQAVDAGNERPYTSSDATTLLLQFKNKSEDRPYLRQSDLYHLFTGKEIEDGIIGLAFVGTACQSDGSFSYGLTRKVMASIQALVTAHEIGHNLGAEHPEEVLSPAPAPSLMTGRVRSDQTQFSEFSIGQISSYIDQFGSCITTKAPRLRLEGRVGANGRVRLRLGATSAAYSNCHADIYGSASPEALSGTLAEATLLFSTDKDAPELAVAGRLRHSLAWAREIYLRGRLRCDQASGLSQRVRMDISREFSERRVGVGRFLRAIKNSLTH